MKRFRRWLFNSLAAISLLLYVATAVLWVQSYTCLGQVAWEQDWLHDTSSPTPPRFRQIFLYSCCGGIALQFGQARPAGASEPQSLTVFLHPRILLSFNDPRATTYAYRGSWSNQNLKERLGFYWAFGHSTYPTLDLRAATIIFPYWLPLAAFTLIPAAWLASVRRRRRAFKKGLCPTCGYDLRATPDRCPECGMIPPKKEMISN
jgi:hypothetical protein